MSQTERSHKCEVAKGVKITLYFSTYVSALAKCKWSVLADFRKHVI